MSNSEFNTVLSYIEQALAMIIREGRGEDYMDSAACRLKDIIFDLEQGYENDHYGYSIYENPYCQHDFL